MRRSANLLIRHRTVSAMNQSFIVPSRVKARKYRDNFQLSKRFPPSILQPEHKPGILSGTDVPVSGACGSIAPLRAYHHTNKTSKHHEKNNISNCYLSLRPDIKRAEP